MKALKCVGAAAVAVVASLSLFDCTEERHPVGQLPPETVKVQGTVYGWMCGVRDFMNNPFDPELSRFSVNTGEAARVTFIGDDGFTTTVETDDSSDFSLHLNPGTYTAVVETGYSLPTDTVTNIQPQTGDTSLSFDVVFCTLDPLNITFAFSYSGQIDRMDMAEEWEVLNRLNEYTYRFGGSHPLLDILDVESPELYRREHSAFTSYDLPIYRNHPAYGTPFSVCEAYELIQGVCDGDTTGLVPDYLYVYPTGTYICKWSTAVTGSAASTARGPSLVGGMSYDAAPASSALLTYTVYQEAIIWIPRYLYKRSQLQIES